MGRALRAPREQTWLRLHREEARVEQACRCHYCRSTLVKQDATADHRKARARGGSNARDNIAAACGDCNNAKGAMTEGRFLAAIKKPPEGDTPFPIMRAWMRRKIALKAERACNAILALTRSVA